MISDPAVDRFHRLYYDRAQTTWKNTWWLGTAVQKCPLDLWVYQELIVELRPELILETGTCAGGSALFLAAMCEIVGRGQVVSVDIAPRPGRPVHPRVTYLTGSSTDEAILDQLRARARGRSPVMAILDSDHSREHVAAELSLYAPLVTVGSYLVVEDTNVNGHPVLPEFGPGPREAVDAFLAANSAFEVDESREKFLMTFNPRGFLRRMR
jgi:cephalosporin hydroxylase